MGKELAPMQGDIQAIETALSKCSVTALREMSVLERTLTLAESMATMRQHFRGDVLERIKGLKGTALGYMTDESGRKDPYANEVIRDCVIEAMLRGATPVGNEFNIIAGRCYLTKQYFERALRQFPGLSELRLVEGVPHQTANGALVPYKASWKLNGQPDSLDCDDSGAVDTRIAVRINSGMGVDAILGKAKRKMLARIFARVSGSEWVDTDSEIPDEVAQLETVDVA
jgi:hypothetical protein